MRWFGGGEAQSEQQKLENEQRVLAIRDFLEIAVKHCEDPTIVFWLVYDFFSKKHVA